MTLPKWMRIAMLMAAVLNLGGALTFLPSARRLRVLGGLPVGSHPVYLATLSAFILTFGVAYFWSAVTGRADRQFVAVAVAGKLSFFGLLIWYWARGDLPGLAPLFGTGDLIFGLLFAWWLYTTRSPD